MRILPVLAIFFFILVTCGCVADKFATAEKTKEQSLQEMNASREYFDRMVAADPGNATA
jgi:hypothetical protein